MKTTGLTFRSLAAAGMMAGLFGCLPEESATTYTANTVDTSPPVILLKGRKTDTTFLQVSSTTLIANATSGYTWFPGNSQCYEDPGACLDGEAPCRKHCVDASVEVTGSVNNNYPGTYLLYYNAVDASGNRAATVTRTVHVVENGAAFLNGNYEVVCTCTAIEDGARTPTITTSRYMAGVTMSGMLNNYFTLSLLNIGPEYLSTPASLRGNAIYLHHYLSGKDYHPASSESGFLSPSKKQFTIETDVHTWKPSVRYTCKNVFTKINTEHNLN